jgi:hypothetical protein
MQIQKSAYILAMSGGIDDDPVTIDVADVEEADMNSWFLAGM